MNARGICLVIEDDLDIRELLVLILSGMGFDVRAAATGAAGIRAAKALDPTLMTLDLGLPDISGHDVARSLREYSNAPIIMITGRARTSDELDGMAAGATAYLTKPFRPVQLRELVQEL
ncbi:response regulator [Pseudarthrobacter psychrotolerans]|uniref:Response regulator n=1 Tax=Pseudarthrobacter psychrotolerans TaxID=2697569 RepID=A0A6P1NR58_9MICC|nr:response regulator [Pseudarthrobacter psychrotolerans]